MRFAALGRKEVNNEPRWRNPVTRHPGIRFLIGGPARDSRFKSWPRRLYSPNINPKPATLAGFLNFLKNRLHYLLVHPAAFCVPADDLQSSAGVQMRWRALNYSFYNF